MSIPVIRFRESNFLIAPFWHGLRHFSLAFSNGSKEALNSLAKERIIFRSENTDGDYAPLTTLQRAYHIILASLETIGYLTLILPFITLYVESFLNFDLRHFPPILLGDEAYQKRTRNPKRDDHIWEYGNRAITDPTLYRKNPFKSEGHLDPFYAGASWVPKST